MRIFLIGIMGSGKTTIGTKVDTEHGYNFLELGLYIVKKENKTIPEIFSSCGENTFREMERRYLREICELGGDTIISTGGGTPCTVDNMDFMNSCGVTIYLKHTPAQLSARLAVSKNPRPLIAGMNQKQIEEFAHKKLEEREPFYNQAQIIVDSPSRDGQKLINAIKYHPKFA